MDYVCATKATENCFLSLERLIFLGHCYLQDSEPLQQILTQSSMPRLAHLACEFDRQHFKQTQQCLRLFASLLPQLSTLAIKAFVFDDIDPVGSLSTCSNLKHLSIESYEANIFDWAAGLALKSLHMPSTTFKRREYRPASIERLIAVANGLEETFRCERVVLHGARETMEKESGVADLSSIEFSSRYHIPFEEFHGNYT
ncbi:hypothetical protein JCM5353_002410 [Sporobolomyces roseus]